MYTESQSLSTNGLYIKDLDLNETIPSATLPPQIKEVLCDENHYHNSSYYIVSLPPGFLLDNGE